MDATITNFIYNYYQLNILLRMGEIIARNMLS